MNILKKACLCLFSVLILSGCIETKGVLSPDYKFNSQSKEGLAVMTVSCNIYKSGINLQVFSVDTEKSFVVPVTCNGPSEPLTEPELKVMNLIPGQYYIPGFYGYDMHSEGFKYVYFDVKPGIINYLGWIKIQSGYSDHVVLQATNAKNRDIPLFRKTALGVNPSVRVEVDEPYTHKIYKRK